MILDSTYIIHLIKRQPAAFQKGIELFEAGIVRRIPVPVLFEVFYGVAFAESDEQRRRARNALMGYPTVELDEHMATLAAELLAEADRAASEESGIEVNDAYIGAAALHHDEPVLTRNVRDFEKLSGVAVETY